MRTVYRLVFPSLVLAAAILALFLLGDPAIESPPGPGEGGEKGVEGPRLAGHGAESPPPAALPSSVVTDAPAPGVSGSVLVRAVVAGSDVPVPGVDVVIEAPHPRSLTTVRTDGRGLAVFAQVPVGTARVHAAGAGWVCSDAEEAAVEAGEEAALRLEMEKAVPLSGVVTAVGDGLPVADAEVTAHAGGSLEGALLLVDRAPYETSVTDTRGRFRIAAVAAGTIVTLRCRAEGYRTVDVPARAVEGTEVHIALERGGSVAGIVTGPEGPVANACVVVAPTEAGDEPDPEEDDAATSTTDEEGHFVVAGLPLAVALAAQADADAWACSEVVEGIRLDEGAQREEIALRLREPASVRLRVLGPDGAPVRATAAIGGAPFGSGLNAAEGRTDAEGRILLDRLDPGKILVLVEAPSFLRWWKRVSLSEGEARELTVHLEAGTSIQGVLVDDRGVGIEGATVLAQSRRHHDPEATTEADGRFSIGGLRADRAYPIQVIAEGHAGMASDPIEAPAQGVRIVAQREGRVRARLVLPAGVPDPATQILEVARGAGLLCLEVPWDEGLVDRAFAPGPCRVRLFASGLQPSEHEVTLHPGETVDLGVVHLERVRLWHGVVVDEGGAPIEGAIVMVLPHIDAPVRTDAEGRFTIEDPGALPQRLAVKAAGHQDGLLRIETPPGGELRVVLAPAD